MSKSIFKKAVCPKCKKWTADTTGKTPTICSCGSLALLSDKWHVRLTVSGKTTVKAVSSRFKDAEDYLHAAKDSARLGKLLPGEEKGITWADAKKEMVKWIDGGSLADGTKENYHGQLVHLSRFFDEDLQEITVKRVEEYRDARLKLVAAKTVAEEIKLLKRIFVLHCGWYPIRKNPELHAASADLAFVGMPKYNNKRLRFLSEPEVKLLLETCTVPHLKLAITIALSTGLRLRNITGLEWKQIDFVKRTITFKPEDMKSKRLHVSPLMAHLATLLATWKLKQAKTGISRFVFPSPTVEFAPMDKMQTAWGTLLDACNVILKKKKQPLFDDVVFHSLRHTFASHFLMNGGDLSTLSELLDHASIQITKDRYGHLNAEHKKNAIDQFAGVFFK